MTRVAVSDGLVHGVKGAIEEGGESLRLLELLHSLVDKGDQVGRARRGRSALSRNAFLHSCHPRVCRHLWRVQAKRALAIPGNRETPEAVMTARADWLPASPQRLRAQGILGVNRRNLEYVFVENPRAGYPKVDVKVVTKRICTGNGIAVQIR